PLLQKSLERVESLAVAIVSCQLGLLSSNPDSLIARKRGFAEAEKATRSAQRILELGWPKEKAGWTAFKKFDSWLRALGNSRNPGITADLVTASLFILLREGNIDPLTPFHWPADFRS